MSASVDVVVAGAGPAGLALAVACAEHGLRVAVADPAHDGLWPNTYGVWVDELGPMGLGGVLRRSWPVTVARTDRVCHRLARRYGLVDNARMRHRLRARLAAAGGREVTGAARSSTPGRLDLGAAGSVPARVVVDATGFRAALSTPRERHPAGYQSAFGIDVRCSRAPGEPDAMTLMDWRGAAGADPTFLYAMDLGAGRWFVQETSLARREPLPFDVLERRLHRRLAAADVATREQQGVERCVFPLGTPAPPAQDVLGYGAAAGMVHPATGYQVGAALSHAPQVAAALVDALEDAGAAPADVARAGWAAVWSRDRRQQRALHELGLACLLGFDGDQLQRFFTAFFALPEARWRAYLSGAPSAGDARTAMLAVFLRTRGLRHHLAACALRSRGQGLRRPAGSARPRR